MIDTHANRAQVAWVPIDRVIPNPLNPRRNDAVKSEEMRDIILRRGWEIPITAYKKGNIYVILAGHRRRFAAKVAGIKEVPVFEVEPPKNHQEEIERIASLQRGQVDWTSYEWAKFTYERWIAWNKPQMKEFSKMLNMTEKRVKEYITVFEYYPRNEVEHKLVNDSLNITNLSATAQWIEKLANYHPKLVEDMGKDLIRKTMIVKNERNQVGHRDFRGNFLEKASDEDVMAFMTSPTMTLKEAQEPYMSEKPKDKFRSVNIRVANLSGDLLEVNVKTEKDKEALLKNLNELMFAIKKKAKELEGINLFDKPAQPIPGQPRLKRKLK